MGMEGREHNDHPIWKHGSPDGGFIYCSRGPSKCVGWACTKTEENIFLNKFKFRFLSDMGKPPPFPCRCPGTVGYGVLFGIAIGTAPNPVLDWWSERF